MKNGIKITPINAGSAQCLTKTIRLRESDEAASAEALA